MNLSFLQQLQALLVDSSKKPSIEEKLQKLSMEERLVSLLSKKGIQISEADKDSLMKLSDAILTSELNKITNNSSDHVFGFKDNDQLYYVPPVKQVNTSEEVFGFGDTDSEINPSESVLEEEEQAEQEEWDLVFYKRPLTIGDNRKITGVDESWASQKGLDSDKIKGSYVMTRDAKGIFHILNDTDLKATGMEGAEVYFSQPRAAPIGPVSTAARVVEPAVESSPPAIAEPKILPIKSSSSTESPNEKIKNFNRENLTHTSPEQVDSKAPNVTGTPKNEMHALLSNNTVLLTMLERAKEKEEAKSEEPSWDDEPDTDMTGSRATPVDLGNVHTK